MNRTANLHKFPHTSGPFPCLSPPPANVTVLFYATIMTFFLFLHFLIFLSNTTLFVRRSTWSKHHVLVCCLSPSRRLYPSIESKVLSGSSCFSSLLLHRQEEGNRFGHQRQEGISPLSPGSNPSSLRISPTGTLPSSLPPNSSTTTISPAATSSVPRMQRLLPADS